MRGKRKLPIVLMVLLAVLGLVVLLYPSFSVWLNARNQTRAIQAYTEALDALDNREIEAQWALAKKYNQNYSSRVLTDLNRVDVPPDYRDVLSLTSNGLMGYIEIPTIDVYLPIYHGTEESMLKRGAGHIPETALPIGGEGQHSVITGHRAMATSELFNDLDLLVEGDSFLLHILDSTLAYQVDQISVVEPDAIQTLLPVPGKDYVTLVTCTPFAVNSHRLLVRGIRTEYRPGDTNPAVASPRPEWLRIVITCFFALWVVLLYVLQFLRRRSPQRKANGQRRRLGLLSILAIFLALLGICILLFPKISRVVHRIQTQNIIADFDRQASIPQENPDPLLHRIQRYNCDLFEMGQTESLRDPFAFEQPNHSLQAMGYNEELFGYLRIEKLDLWLPVYLGASRENMLRGAAHLTHTSIPVGGRNTNAAIIGHRNLMRAEMFRDIHLLEAGDPVQFTNRWETLTYRVTEAVVITPDKTEYLLIQPGRDLLTLVTCHPRGKSTYRYLVYCERTP